MLTTTKNEFFVGNQQNFLGHEFAEWIKECSSVARKKTVPVTNEPLRNNVRTRLLCEVRKSVHSKGMLYKRATLTLPFICNIF